MSMQYVSVHVSMSVYEYAETIRRRRMSSFLIPHLIALSQGLSLDQNLATLAKWAS